MSSHISLYKREAGALEKEVRCEHKSERKRYEDTTLLTSKIEREREVMSQGMQVTFRSCKRKGNGSSPRVFKRNTAG